MSLANIQIQLLPAAITTDSIPLSPAILGSRTGTKYHNATMAVFPTDRMLNIEQLWSKSSKLNWKREEHIRFFFDPDFCSEFYELFSETRQGGFDANVILEENIRVMILLLLPISKFGNPIRSSLALIQNTRARGDEVSDEITHLRLKGNDYTVTEVLWVDDVLNHPFYKKLFREYWRYLDWISSVFKKMKLQDIQTLDTEKNVFYRKLKEGRYIDLNDIINSSQRYDAQLKAEKQPPNANSLALKGLAKAVTNINTKLETNIITNWKYEYSLVQSSNSVLANHLLSFMMDPDTNQNENETTPGNIKQFAETLRKFRDHNEKPTPEFFKEMFTGISSTASGTREIYVFLELIKGKVEDVSSVMCAYRNRKLYKVHARTIWMFGQQKKYQTWNIFRNSTYFDMNNPNEVRHESDLIESDVKPTKQENGRNDVNNNNIPMMKPLAKQSEMNPIQLKQMSDVFETNIINADPELRTRIQTLESAFSRLSASNLLSQLLSGSLPTVGVLTSKQLGGIVVEWANNIKRKTPALVTQLRRLVPSLQIDLEMLEEQKKVDKFKNVKSKSDNETLIQVTLLYQGILKGLLTSEQAKPSVAIRGGKQTPRKIKNNNKHGRRVARTMITRRKKQKKRIARKTKNGT